MHVLALDGLAKYFEIKDNFVKGCCLPWQQGLLFTVSVFLILLPWSYSILAAEQLLYKMWETIVPWLFINCLLVHFVHNTNVDTKNLGRLALPIELFIFITQYLELRWNCLLGCLSDIVTEGRSWSLLVSPDHRGQRQLGLRGIMIFHIYTCWLRVFGCITISHIRYTPSVW